MSLLLFLGVSFVSDSATPQTIAHQALLSTGFPRLEYWSGLPFPSSGDLPDPGIKFACPALAAGFFTTEPPGKPPNILRTTQDCFSISNKLNFKTVIHFLVSSLILIIHDNATHLWSTYSVFCVRPIPRSFKAATIINTNSQMKKQQPLAWRDSDPCEGKAELGQ